MRAFFYFLTWSSTLSPIFFSIIFSAVVAKLETKTDKDKRTLSDSQMVCLAGIEEVLLTADASRCPCFRVPMGLKPVVSSMGATGTPQHKQNPFTPRSYARLSLVCDLV